MPVTNLRMKVAAEKKTPSARRPVLSSACSTRSAIIDEPKIPKAMMRPTSIMVETSTNQKMKGEPLGGKSPKSLKTTGMGEPRNATKPMMMAPILLPIVRLARREPGADEGRNEYAAGDEEILERIEGPEIGE